MDVEVKGKRVLVTGGNSGIGEAMALAFADAGADVAINYVTNEPAAKKLAQAIEAKGRRSLALEANVADQQQVAKIFDQIDRVWGGIDVLLANAEKSGVILFTSSVHQRIAWSGHAGYAATKAGLDLLMRTMAQELGPFGVRVLSVAPGAVATPINKGELTDRAWQQDIQKKVPMQRVGRPDEIASVALFLASDRASYVTATTVFVDGGMTDYPSFAHGG